MININDPDEALSNIPAQESSANYRLGEWCLNINNNRLQRGGEIVELEYRLTTLLVFLLRNKNRVLSKDEILKVVWHKKVVNDDSVAVAISQLRKALDDSPRTPKYIKTIPGVGYQFIYQQALAVPLPVMTAVVAEAPKRFKGYESLSIGIIFLLIAVGASYSLWREIALKPMVSAPPEVLSKDATLLAEAMRLSAGWKTDELRTAIRLYKQLGQKNFANAHVYLGIAEAKIKLLDGKMTEADNYQEVMALLNKALELDPKLARAHLWLAEVFFVHDGQPVAAEQHYKTAITLAPKDDLIHCHYAHFLFIYKRFAEAREQINISRLLNPLNFSATSLVWVYLLQGDNELAARELSRIESTEDADVFFKVTAQNVYYQMGDAQKTYENLQWFFKKAEFSEEKINSLDKAFAAGGLKSVYQWLLDHKEAADVGQYTPPISWARYAAAVGDKKSAINYLEQAFEKRQPHIECVVADPHYALLKDELKFKELLAKFGFPAQK